MMMMMMMMMMMVVVVVMEVMRVMLNLEIQNFPPGEYTDAEYDIIIGNDTCNMYLYISR